MSSKIKDFVISIGGSLVLCLVLLWGTAQPAPHTASQPTTATANP